MSVNKITVTTQGILPYSYVFRFYVTFTVYSAKYSATHPDFQKKPESVNQTNFGDLFVDLPGNVGSTAIMVVCYALVMWKLRKSRQAVAGSMNSTQEAKKKAREARLSIQFLIIALVYLVVWSIFRIGPLIIGRSASPEVYVTTTLLVVVNSTVNPVIYLGK